MADIGPLQKALEGRDFGVRLARRAGMPPHRFTARLYHPRKPIALSDILPLAENLGLRVLSEVPFQLLLQDGRPVPLPLARWGHRAPPFDGGWGDR